MNERSNGSTHTLSVAVFLHDPGRPAASLRISHRDRIATAPEVRPGARNRPLISPILKTPDRVLMREARKWRVRSCFNHTGLCAHIISFRERSRWGRRAGNDCRSTEGCSACRPPPPRAEPATASPLPPASRLARPNPAESAVGGRSNPYIICCCLSNARTITTPVSNSEMHMRFR